MLKSIWNLLPYAWDNMVSAIGTTTLGFCIFWIIIPLIYILVRFFIGWQKDRWDKMTIKTRLKESLRLVDLGIYVFVFFMVFCYFAANTAYTKYKVLQDKVGKLEQQRSPYEKTDKRASDKTKDSKNITINQDNIKAAEKEKKNKEIADKIADFRIKGLTIQNQCYGGFPLYPGKTARQAYEQWDAEIEKFFRNRLTDSEKADLMDVYNLPSNEIIPGGLSPENQHTWIFVGRKIKRLEQLNQKYK